MNNIRRFNITRILLNIIFFGFVFYSSINNNTNSVSWIVILVYNLLLFTPSWINNFWLLSNFRNHKKIFRYITEISILYLASIFILGQYLNILQKKFNNSTLDNFTSFAVTSSAPNNLKMYQYYYDVFPGIFLVIIVMTIGYVIQEYLLKIKTEQRIKAQQNVAELALLKSQISPHFLFNVLNSLYALALKSDKETPEVILKLSDILRYSLYETQEKEISINDEIHILNTYIDIEKIRISTSTNISFNHKKIAESVKIAPMLLLPLIENAFKHGTDSTIAASFINIDLSCDEKKLCFVCENNYKEQSKNDFGGIGIKNIKKRLELLYPKKHLLEIKKNIDTFKVTLEINF